MLLSSVFFVGVTAVENPYDHWLDVNDDGEIDIFDVVKVAGAYGTTGTPINKTELLLEMTQKIENLTTRLEILEHQSGWLPAPTFDSGWISINPGDRYYFFHNLSTTNVFVYVIGKNASGFIHQWRIGMDYDSYVLGSSDIGLFWSRLDANIISVVRGRTDVQWNYVRVQIWRIPES